MIKWVSAVLLTIGLAACDNSEPPAPTTPRDAVQPTPDSEIAEQVAVDAEPFFRYQRFSYDDGASGSRDRYDAGVNFILKGLAGSKLAVNYFHTDSAVGASNDGVFLGLQVQF